MKKKGEFNNRKKNFKAKKIKSKILNTLKLLKCLEMFIINLSLKTWEFIKTIFFIHNIIRFALYVVLNIAIVLNQC